MQIKTQISNFSVTQNGQTLDPSKYTWDEDSKTFSTTEDGLVLDFNNIHEVTFKTGSSCTFDTGSSCTFDTGSNCTFKTGYGCIFKTGYGCTFNTRSYCTFDTGSTCTFKTGYHCTFDTGSSCTFDIGSSCTFDTGSNCTFDTGSNCTFNTYSYCTFKTGSYCTFDTGKDCTFKTGSDCTFDTGSNCTFDTGSNCTFNTDSYCTFTTGYGCTFKAKTKTNIECVVVRRDVFEIVQLTQYETILNPHGIKGFISKVDDSPRFYLNGDKNLGEHIIIDNILSKVLNKKGNVYKVINYGDTDVSFILKQNNIYAHGRTLKEARDSLVYKLADRNTTKYINYNLDTNISKNDAIQMYMNITGACAFGTKQFVDKLKDVKETYTVKEIIKLTNGQFGNDTLRKFFKLSV